MFNTFLQKEYFVESLEEVNLNDINKYSQLYNQSLYRWNKVAWPNSDTGGVYFLFAYEKNNRSNTAVYIGKASFSSSIGNRLYSHLNDFKREEHYLIWDGDGKEYVIELISSIDLDKRNRTFLASALEEFLITKMPKEINLINVTGNK